MNNTEICFAKRLRRESLCLQLCHHHPPCKSALSQNVTTRNIIQSVNLPNSINLFPKPSVYIYCWNQCECLRCNIFCDLKQETYLYDPHIKVNFEWFFITGSFFITISFLIQFNFHFILTFNCVKNWLTYDP